MAEAKYSIAIAALDQFSAPFKSFSASSDKFTEQIKGQQAELRKLKKVQADLSSLDRQKYKLEQVTASLNEAKLSEKALGLEQQQLTSQLNNTATALTAAQYKQQQLAAEVARTEKPTKALTTAYREARKEVKSLEREHHQQTVQLERLAQSEDKVKNKTRQLNAEHQVQTNKLKSLDQSLKKARVDANKFASEQQRIERATEKANNALKTQQARLKSVAVAQSKVDANKAARADLRGQVLETAAIGYVAAQPIKAAINYESSMADVKKVVNFKDDAEAAKMGRDILKMSTSIPIAAEGIAKIVSAAGQSGVAKAELLDFATSAAKMATAFDVSAEQAGSTMAGWRASMGLTQQQAVKLADATNYLSNNMNAQAKDIAGVLKRQGAVAMSAGLNEVQAASLSAALLSGGASEEIAATALKNITGSMMKGSNATKAQQSAWSELGFDPNQLSADMISNAPETMIRVFEAMQDVPDEQISALVSTLFGEEAKGSVMPMLKNMDNLKKAFLLTGEESRLLGSEQDQLRILEVKSRKELEKKRKFAGSMEEEYKARSATTANGLLLFKHSVERLMITVGTQLLPALNAIAKPAGEFINSLADAAEKYPMVAKGIAMAGMGLVGLKVGALALKMVGLTLGQGMNKIKLGRAKLSATTGSTARNATLANRALQRMNATMARMGRRRGAGMGGGYDAGYGGDYDSGRDSKKRGKKGRRFRMRGGGKWGRIAGLIGGGTALSMMSASANAGDMAMAGADVAGIGASMMGGLPVGGMLKGAGKLFRPLDIALSGAALTSAISNGDNKAIGGTAGDLVGGMGGAAAGAMAGAAIGSVVPIIGTAIGGLVGSIIGGIGGGALGQWGGETIGGWFGGDKEPPKPGQVSQLIAKNDRVNGTTDKLPTPAQVQKQVAKSDNRQMVFSPTITIPPSSGNPEADERLISTLLERMKSELMPMMGGGDLAVRLDASLSDRNS